jgi:hypothetical protein
MAEFIHKEGQGSIFPNDKGDNPNRPDMRGKLMIGGVLYELAIWEKSGQRGTFWSVSAKPAQERQQGGQQRPSMREEIKSRKAPAEKPYGDESEIDPSSIPF